MAILNDLNNIIVWLDFVINVVNMYKGLFYTFTISHQCSPLNGNIIATATISITVTAKKLQVLKNNWLFYLDCVLLKKHFVLYVSDNDFFFLVVLHAIHFATCSCLFITAESFFTWYTNFRWLRGCMWIENLHTHRSPPYI